MTPLNHTIVYEVQGLFFTLKMPLSLVVGLAKI